MLASEHEMQIECKSGSSPTLRVVFGQVARHARIPRAEFKKAGSGGRARTYDLAVNSRPLYH